MKIPQKDPSIHSTEQSDSLVWTKEVAETFESLEELLPQTFMGKVAFAVNMPSMLGHYTSILDALPSEKRTIVNFCSNYSEALLLKNLCEKHGYQHKTVYEVLKGKIKYAVLVSHIPFNLIAPPFFPQPGVYLMGLFQHIAFRQVRMMYALGKDQWNLRDWNAYYHEILVYGPYHEEQLSSRFQVSIRQVGYPRFDSVLKGEVDRDRVLESLSLPIHRQTIVWLPTWQELCSIPKFYKAVCAVSDRYNVIVKPHPLISPTVLDPLRNTPSIKIIEQKDYDNAELFAVANWILADYGGSPFGAICCDKNLILLNMETSGSQEYMSQESPDVILREHIINFDDLSAEQLESILQQSSIWEQQAQTRQELRVRYFYKTDGHAGQRAADYLLSSIKTVVQQGVKRTKVLFLSDSYMANGQWSVIQQAILKHLALTSVELLAIKANAFLVPMGALPRSPHHLEQLCKHVSSYDPDVVISLNSVGLCPAVRSVLSPNCRIVSWFVDGNEIVDPGLQDYDSRDYVFYIARSNYIENKKKLEEEHAVFKAKYIPWGADISVFNNQKIKRDIEIGFCGTAFTNHQFVELVSGLQTHLDELQKLLRVFAKHQQQYLPNLVTALEDENFNFDSLSPLMNFKDANTPKEIERQLRIAFSGQLGMEERLHALAAVADKKLVIYGEPLKTWVEHLARVDSRLLDRYQHQPINTLDELATFYNQSLLGLNVMVDTNRSEGQALSMRVFELMACGTLLLNPGYARDVMADLGFVDGKDYIAYDSPEHLTQLCDYYLTHPDELKAIAESGYQKVMEKHTLRHRLVQILESVGLHGEAQILMDNLEQQTARQYTPGYVMDAAEEIVTSIGLKDSYTPKSNILNRAIDFLTQNGKILRKPEVGFKTALGKRLQFKVVLCKR